MRHYNFIFGIFFLFTPATLYALPEDTKKPINIQSDRASFDRQSGTTTYAGNVVMSQGSMHIHADSVNIFSNQKKAIRVVATGNPGRFQQTPAQGDSPIVASAEIMTYDIESKILTLTKSARLEQDGAQISGPEIIYDVNAETVRAGKSNSNTPEDRVKMIIPPQTGNE